MPAAETDARVSGSIVSLLPCATEIVCALGLRDRLAGITHECDYPLGLDALPRLTASRLAGNASSAAIDGAVRASMESDAHTVYALDVQLLAHLNPDVIITQQLCDVCAVPAAAVEAAVCTMPRAARIVSLDPMTLDDVIDCVEKLGQALGVAEDGHELAGRLRARVEEVRVATAGASTTPVLAAEWLNPVYCGGHWVPGMVAAAGGSDPFGIEGERSRTVGWDEVAAAEPDVVILMPCGFHADEVVSRYEEITATPEFQGLRAVRNGKVYAVDATAYFSGPGPRVVEGVGILARILHPDRVPQPLASGMAYKLRAGGGFAPYL